MRLILLSPICEWATEAQGDLPTSSRKQNSSVGERGFEVSDPNTCAYVSNLAPQSYSLEGLGERESEELECAGEHEER